MVEEKKNKPLTTAEMKQVFKTGIVLSICSVTFMTLLALMVNNDVVKFYPRSMQVNGVETLKGFASRAEYALRYQTLQIFWLLFMVLVTIYGRITTMAINPLDDRTEHKVAMFKFILTNSFESCLISIFSQLIFISFAQPITILKFIPYINIVALIGRIAFFAGYPLKRAFGYHCALVPNVVLNIYNIWKLGSFIGLY